MASHLPTSVSRINSRGRLTAGDRIGIFTFNDLGETGYLDVDDFQYKIQR